MIGILYILNCILVGAVFCDFFLPKLAENCVYNKDGKTIRIPGFFVLFPAWFITGTVFQTWLVYFVGYGFKSLRHPLTPANAIVVPTLFVLSIAYFVAKMIRTKKVPGPEAYENFFIGDKFGYFVFTVIITIFTIIIMYRTLHFTKAGELYIGNSVWADFGAHLGMIRSFSYGNNFPTQYTYFGGEDIKYHFMFQFLVGNLEYLGLRLDHAFNIPSILSFISMYLLLFTLTVQVLGSRLTAWFGALLFTFRSSPSVFKYLEETTQAGTKGVKDSGVSGWQAIKDLSAYFNYSSYQEAWGFWCTRVFCNQRHLALGISALLLALIVFLPYLKNMGQRLLSLKDRLDQEDTDYPDERIEILLDNADTAPAEEIIVEKDVIAEEVDIVNAKLKAAEESRKAREAEEAEEYEESGFSKVLNWCKLAILSVGEMFFTSYGWKVVNPKSAIGMGLFLGAIGFWHGSALMVTLSMLFFMAAFSMGRLDYVITAVLSVGISFLQTKFFITGSAVAPEYYFGFLASKKTFWGVMVYIFLLTGITLLLALLGALKHRGVKRYLFFVFMIPFILSFFMKLTTDVGVNHKWIIISLMLISMYTADFVVELLRKRDAGKWIVAVILIFCLTATGMAELKIQYVEDDRGWEFNQNHPLTLWLKENTSSQDLVLTSEAALSNIVLSGVMSYYAYPYCVWSAGYNTEPRVELRKQIFEATSPEELDYYVRVAGVDFIIIDINVRESSSFALNEANIASAYKEVFTMDEGQWQVRIFDTSKKLFK